MIERSNLGDGLSHDDNRKQETEQLGIAVLSARTLQEIPNTVNCLHANMPMTAFLDFADPRYALWELFAYQ